MDAARLHRLYSAGWILAAPLALVYLLWRGRRQPAYRQHWGERFGHGGRVTDDQRPIWIHAVSVGETAAAVPLIQRLAVAYPRAVFLLTHGTPTGRDTGRAQLRVLGDRLTQCYLPYDLSAAVERFFINRRPLLGLIMEAEVWPNLMSGAQAHGVPVVSVNARLSEKSLARGLRFKKLIGPALAAFELIIAQTAADSARMARLGRPADAISGNLKFDQTVSPGAQRQGFNWRRRFGTRPVVLAASTREGEEALILDSWRSTSVREATQRGNAVATLLPLLIVVPRHPNRFDEAAGLMDDREAGHRVLRRDALDDPAIDLSRCELLLGDSMGEMQTWYSAADVAIIGGSLLPFGSQNLIEANALGCPVVVGPSIYNFEQAVIESVAAGASTAVSDGDQAVTTALAIARDPGRRDTMSRAALDFTETHRGAVDRTLAALAPVLDRVLGAAMPAG